MIQRVLASCLGNGRNGAASPPCSPSRGGTGMTIPTTTSGALGRVRSRIAPIPATNARSLTCRVARGALLAAMLATVVAALAGALAAAGARADPHPDHRPTYKVTADLDGRATPAKGDHTTIVAEDFLRKGQRVPVICQANGGLAYG